MKYFTRDAMHSSFGASWDEACNAYAAYLTSVHDQLPPLLVMFLTKHSLHDSLFEKVVLDVRQGRLMIRLVMCHSYLYRYATATFIFEQLPGPVSPPHWVRIVEDPKTEVLYEEIECLVDGGYELRLLCWPVGELGIQFREVRWDIQPRQGYRDTIHGVQVEIIE